VTTGVADVASRSATTAPATTTLDIVAWLATVGMLLLYSQAWLVPLFGETVNVQEGSLVRALYIPGYLVGLFLVAQKPGASMAGLIRQPFLIAILCIAAASTAWSISPDQTSRRALAVVLTTLCGVAIGARWRWAAMAEMLAATFGVLTIGSLVAGLFIPSIGRMSVTFPGAWRGLWLEKNIFGGQMAFALLIFAAAGMLRPERRRLWFSLALVAFAMMFASTSKTSLVAVTLGFVGFCLVLVLRRGGSLAVIAAWGAAVALIGLATVVMLSPDMFLNLLGKDATLTGRTKIWAAVMRQIQLRPWFGWGYGAVWSEDAGWGPLAWIVKQAGFTPQHAHNSWLEQWLGMGLWGLGAWSLYYLMTMVRAIAAMFRSDGALVAVPFLIVYTMTTLTESVAVSYNDMRWVVFVAFSVRLAVRERGPISPPAAARLPQR
jgi:exopolysaccharide production protein ExoQ